MSKKVSRNPITVSPEEFEAEEEERVQQEAEDELDIPEQKDVRKRDYKLEKFTLTPENINNFTILDDRRQISEAMVRRIHGALLENKNPIGILVINRKEGKDRLIDGNHRIEAIKRYFDYRKTAAVKIDCTLKVYENLTPDQERQVYLDEAQRRNEGLDDRLNMFKNTLTIWNLLNDHLNPFPCGVSIYPSSSTIKLKTILNSIATVRRQPGTSFVSLNLGKNDIIDFARDVQFDEFHLMREFMTMFVKIFGLVDKNNMFTKSQFFTPLFDIYVMNLQQKKTYEERFKKIVGRQDLMEFKNMVNRTAAEKIRALMLNYMNRGYSANKFQ